MILLRKDIKRCPQCMYDIHLGVTDDRCPECGLAFDDSMIVFQSSRPVAASAKAITSPLFFFFTFVLIGHPFLFEDIFSSKTSRFVLIAELLLISGWLATYLYRNAIHPPFVVFYNHGISVGHRGFGQSKPWSEVRGFIPPSLFTLKKLEFDKRSRVILPAQYDSEAEENVFNSLFLKFTKAAKTGETPEIEGLLKRIDELSSKQIDSRDVHQGYLFWIEATIITAAVGFTCIAYFNSLDAGRNCLILFGFIIAAYFLVKRGIVG